MAILPQVGRKSTGVKLTVAGIYATLLLGGLTMVFPFLITLTASVSNEMDYERFDPFPAYFFRSDFRFGKYLAEKYATIRFEQFASAYGAPSHWSTFKDLGFERGLHDLLVANLDQKPKAQLCRIVEDYDAFLSSYDMGNVIPLFANWAERDCQSFLRNKYERITAKEIPSPLSRRSLSKQALEMISSSWNEGVFLYWDYVNFKQELQYPYHLRRWIPWDEPRGKDYVEFLRWLPASRKLPITARYLWCIFLLDQGIQVEEIDERWGSDFGSIYRIPQGDIADLPPPLAALWERFCDESWPMRLTEIPLAQTGAFRRFIEERYGSIDAMNRMLKTAYTEFDEVPFSARLPEEPALRPDWVDFGLTVPASERKRISAESCYREFLAAKYGQVDRLNAAYGWTLSGIKKAPLPIREVDYLDYVENGKTFFTRFLTFNFVKVIHYIAGRGRALPNTLILVLLTIAFTLTVNPLAAYALSRFRLKATQQILVYLLATMAFPAEVGMIPGFLLLRDLHLLNTFAALILPGMASGFSIFLLKGFFDSLPQELYEAASIDGASEMRMFGTITLPLSAPILSVIALNAFLQAYGSFMWAFLVCQDPEKWTLMVWLYQFQQLNQGPWLVMAAIVISSIPTLMVFVFCQKIILRGIILPSMK